MAKPVGLLLLAAVAMALLLRVWGITGLSVSHHDEACYWMSGFLLFADSSLHPALPLQSPPGYPLAMSLVHHVLGRVWYPSGVLISVLFGTATIPLVYLIGRQTAGPWLGLAAAWGVALSDLHVAFSRTWLTDATFTFWFVLALFAILKIFEKASVRWIALATLATALAWSVKYNGWMPIAIGLAAVVVEASRRWLRRNARFALGSTPLADTQDVAAENENIEHRAVPSSRSLFLRLALAGLAAGALFLPWYGYVKRHLEGGYATVAEHHAKFFEGIGAWPAHALHLALELPAFRHLGWILSLAAGCVLALVILFGIGLRTIRERFGVPRNAPLGKTRWLVGVLIVLAVCAALFAGTDTLWFAAAGPGALVCVLWGHRRDVLLAAWCGAFLVLVPLYHPYIRLLVPAVPAAILVTLRAVSLLIGNAESVARGGRLLRRRVALWAMIGMAGAVSMGVGRLEYSELAGIWQRWSVEHSYRAFAEYVDESTPPRATLVCLTQPTIWCGLNRVYRLPTSSPLLPPGLGTEPIYLAVDFTIHQHPDLHAEFDRLRPYLTYVGSVSNRLSVPALLDFLSPNEFWEKVGAVTPEPPSDDLPESLESFGAQRIVLYRLDRSCAAADPTRERAEGR